MHRDAVEAMSTMVQSSAGEAGEAGEAGKASERVGAGKASEHVRRVRSEEAVNVIVLPRSASSRYSISIPTHFHCRQPPPFASPSTLKNQSQVEGTGCLTTWWSSWSHGGEGGGAVSYPRALPGERRWRTRP